MTCGLEGACSVTRDSVSATKALAFVVIGGGFASFLRTTMLHRAQDNIAKRLRAKLFSAVLTDRDMQWFVSGEGVKSSKIHPDDGKKDEANAEDIMSAS